MIFTQSSHNQNAWQIQDCDLTNANAVHLITINITTAEWKHPITARCSSTPRLVKKGSGMGQWWSSIQGRKQHLFLYLRPSAPLVYLQSRLLWFCITRASPCKDNKPVAFMFIMFAWQQVGWYSITKRLAWLRNTEKADWNTNMLIKLKFHSHY